MSRGWGARTERQSRVLLNVYDLHDTNEYLEPFGLGLFHTGVQVGGREYTFAGGGGVFDMTPQEAPGAKFREAIDMGAFEGSESKLASIIDELKPQFKPDSYNILTKNCNHFSDALVRRLLAKPIPGYLNRLAMLGGCCGPCLPPSLGGTGANGPVGGPGGGGGSGGGGGGSGSVRGLSVPPIATEAFAGKGQSLGTSTSGSRQRPVVVGSESDRRERIRAATLARMNRGADADPG